MIPEAGHILTLGATGMLAGVVSELETREYKVSQLSRSGRGTHGYACDWKGVGSVEAATRTAMADLGPPIAALIWSHNFGQAIPLIRAVSSPQNPLPVFHVLGSSVSNPANYDVLKRMRATIDMIGGINWHPICLGFVIEDERSRWLTHAEISEGVLDAMNAPAPLTTIGRTRPWARRPK